MEKAPRTRDEAEKILLKLAPEVSLEIADTNARELFTEDIILAAFKIAWRHQFDEDQSAAQTQLRELISDHVEEHLVLRK